jgi:hypothetical protein
LSANISWQSNGDYNANYLIFRANGYNNNFVQIGSTAANQTNFIDVSPLPNNNVYMIRARSLCTTGSGSYYNLSPGVFAEFSSSFSLNSQLSSEIRCQNSTSIDLTYNMSNNLINSTATVVCYSGNSSQPFFSESITLSNVESFQFQIPAVEQGTWLKYKTTVNAFSGLETVDSLLIKSSPEAVFTSELSGNTILANANTLNVDSLLWIVNGVNAGTNAELTLELNSSITVIELIVENECGSDTSKQTISITANQNLVNDRINVFPNPSADLLHINNISPNSNITLIDVTGRVVAIINDRSKLNEQIQVQNLANGLYFIKVEESTKFYTTSFIVSH